MGRLDGGRALPRAEAAARLRFWYCAIHGRGLPLPCRLSRCRDSRTDNSDYVFSVLQEVRPDIVLLYSAWSGVPFYDGFLPNLQDLVSKLRLLHIPRVIIMGSPPVSNDGLPKAAYDYFWREHRIIPQLSNFRLNASFRTFVQNFREQVLPLGTEYVSAWDALCRGSDCITRAGEDAADLIAFDQAHLTIPGSICPGSDAAKPANEKPGTAVASGPDCALVAYPGEAVYECASMGPRGGVVTRRSAKPDGPDGCFLKKPLRRRHFLPFSLTGMLLLWGLLWGPRRRIVAPFSRPTP
jgi:hypothetical protein